MFSTQETKLFHYLANGTLNNKTHRKQDGVSVSPAARGDSVLQG